MAGAKIWERYRLLRIRFSLKMLFGPNFYHKMRPLSLFFGLLPIYRSFPVTRHDSYPAHDTVQLFSYHLQNKSGRYLARLASSGPAQKLDPLPRQEDFLQKFFQTWRTISGRKKVWPYSHAFAENDLLLKKFFGKKFLGRKKCDFIDTHLRQQKNTDLTL